MTSIVNGPFSRLGAVVLFVVSWSGCQPRNEFVPPPPPIVTVARPIERPVQMFFQATGVTEAAQKVELRARVSGYLHEINFEDGQLVKKGDVLFVVDKEPYEVEVASAQAQLKRAQAQLKLAEQELSRTQKLAQSQATTQSQLDEVAASRDVTAADVAAAQAALREAELNLEDTEVVAPFDGRISETLIDVGNLVQAGETLLATIESVSPMYAYFTVSEQDLLRFIRMQESGELKISDADPIEIELSLQGTSDFPFKGRLDYREFGIDPSTGTTRRRAWFENADERLIPGLFIHLRAAVGEPKMRLLVEERALGADQRGDFLLVVNDEDVVEARSVTIGSREGEFRVIESGLRPGERVVVNGLQRARPGAKVTPEERAMGAAVEASPGTAGGDSPAESSAGDDSHREGVVPDDAAAGDDAGRESPLPGNAAPNSPADPPADQSDSSAEADRQ